MEFFNYVPGLHSVGLEELAARGSVVEQVADAEVGAFGGGDLLHFGDLASDDGDLCSQLIVLGPGAEHDI